jgi:hypothetical protein
MKIITVAFDVDSTLVHEDGSNTATPVPKEGVRALLIHLAKMQNVLIHVWSGAGEAHARKVVAAIGLASYVDSYSVKPEPLPPGVVPFSPKAMPKVTPDIAFDNDPLFNLGVFNLILSGDDVTQSVHD